MRYQVIVGNIGTVIDTNSFIEANMVYSGYRKLSREGVGRAAYEQVTLLKDNEPKYEHFPDTCWGCEIVFGIGVSDSKCSLKNENTNNKKVFVCVACYEELSQMEQYNQ